MFDYKDCIKRNALFRRHLGLPPNRYKDIIMCENLRKMIKW